MKNKIIQGDCIEKLKELLDNSVDAIVTDPPYNLASIVKRFGKKGSAPAQFGKDGSFNRLSKGFMGKEWDNEIAFGTKVWKECLRVLKPGGFLLSFGGTRTYQDTIMWLYGSGFPKSLNIGKQIDKIQGNDREVVGEKIRGDVEKAKQGVTFAGADANKGNKDIFGYGKETLTKGSSEWEGWGTALKPACEPIVVARKPLSEKNVALNVLKHGTGGINIDATRIGTEILKEHTSGNIPNDRGKWGLKEGYKMAERQGRFPANIILNEEAGKMLDEQSGQLKSGDMKGKKGGFGNSDLVFGDNSEIPEAISFGDKGGASRFFYCAKASKSERNYGCEDIEQKKRDIIREHGQVGTDNAFNRDATLIKNNHPTVKPIKLMEYLIKLVSKEGATVLDPFLGSGTTAIAAIKLNRNFIGIEKEEEYIKIAEARIKPFLEQKKLK